MGDDVENIVLIPGLLQDKIYKKLIFTKEGLTIEKPMSFAPVDFISAADINSIRYGINWLRGYCFVIGRQYIIQVQDVNNHVTSIKLNSYYGIRSKAYGKLWSDIFQQLWKNYFADIFGYYQNMYNQKQEFELAGVKFHPFGISWDNSSLFWDEIALSNYQTYFMIHHRNDPQKTKGCNFLRDWNAIILQHLLKYVIKEQIFTGRRLLSFPSFQVFAQIPKHFFPYIFLVEHHAVMRRPRYHDQVIFYANRF